MEIVAFTTMPAHPLLGSVESWVVEVIGLVPLEPEVESTKRYWFVAGQINVVLEAGVIPTMKLGWV